MHLALIRYKIPDFFSSLLESWKKCAAIDNHGLAGHVGTAVTGHKQGESRNVFWLTDTVDWLLADNFIPTRVVFPIVLTERGLNQARSDSVDTYALGTEFERIGFRHHN